MLRVFRESRRRSLHGVSSGANVTSEPSRHRFPTESRQPPTIASLQRAQAQMILPQELVDEILVHLRNDNQALQNCSLVAKSWTYPSQKLLYTYVLISPIKYKTWQEIASPTSAELLRQVYSLKCFRFNSLYDFHEGYLKSFHHLQRLSLDQVHHVDLDTTSLFPAFRNSLSSLSLSHVSLTLDAFINLIGHFPKLKELYLNEPRFDSEHLTVPPPSTPPHGALRLFMLSDGSADIPLRALCELKPEYDELEIYRVHGNPSHVRSIISTCEKTITHLRLGPQDCKL